ncbi:MAG: hypothetical protein KKH94_11395 [Candidatus Omnitrophica bacterium]|nr:hypothetical protein [Candidatus Omnitrophota bacterium]
MKRVKILKDTFIKGSFAAKGKDYDVDDRTAMYLISSNKALEINPTTGKQKKEDLSGPLESIPKQKKEEQSAKEVVAEKISSPVGEPQKEITSPPASSEEKNTDKKEETPGEQETNKGENKTETPPDSQSLASAKGEQAGGKKTKKKKRGRNKK